MASEPNWDEALMRLNEYARGYAEGVKAERAAVVAWLRATPMAEGGVVYGPHDDACQLVADNIQSGDHVTPREAEE